MPRLNPNLEKCVFFLYGIDASTGQLSGPGGTGFVVCRKSEDGLTERYYGITNAHVAKTGGWSIIRINTADGRTRQIERDPSEWIASANRDDVAAIDLTDEINAATDELICIPEGTFASQQFATDFGLGLGEDVFMLGMFANSPGKGRNLPVARFGNISRLADGRAPIRQPTNAERPSHLVDLRSRTGFSGSPVFVYRTPSADLTDVQEGDDWTLDTVENYFLRLLGIQCAQYSEYIEVATAQGWGAPILEGDRIESPSAMNIVVPAWCITELLDHPEFRELR